MRVARKLGLYLACRKPITMAPARRSGGSPLVCEDSGRHQSRAPMTPKLLNALIQNGAAIPSAPITTPPSAGPIALEMLMPTPLLATADASSCLGTS